MTNILRVQKRLFRWWIVPVVSKAGLTNEIHPYKHYWGQLIKERIE